MSRKRGDAVSAGVSATARRGSGVDGAFLECLRVVYGLFESAKERSSAAGRSDDSLAKWATGESRPPFGAIASLTAAKGVSLEWLATGEKPMLLVDRAMASSGTDGVDQLFGVIFFEIRKAYMDTETVLDDDELFDRAKIAYRKAMRPGISEADRVGVVKGYARDLAEELAARRTAADAKRSA